MWKRYMVMRTYRAEVTYWNGSGFGPRESAVTMKADEARKIMLAYDFCTMVEV